jgi:DNA-directed RNA polymerase subunit RPC12/RpoP
MSSRMRIELTCAECHKNSFNLGHGVEDDSVIRCTSCGHEIGTMAELKERVAAEVLKRAENERAPGAPSLMR